MVNYGGEKMIISELAYHKLLRNGDFKYAKYLSLNYCLFLRT